MPLAKIVKAKLPKLPKDIEDKPLQKLVPRLEKEFAAFQKSAAALLGEFEGMMRTAVEVQDACIDGYSDKKRDPKQIKLISDYFGDYKDFYDTVADI